MDSDDYETDEEFYPESSDDGSKGSSIFDPLNVPAADSFRREVDLVRLQQDFNGVVAAGFRPGYIPERDSLSVSIPVLTLASLVPSRALAAWDRRILAQPQYLTLTISNMNGTYPFTRHDGSYDQLRQPTFKVGLSPMYKPSFGGASADAEDAPANADVGDPREGPHPEWDDLGGFDVSQSLEHVMNEVFLFALKLRVQYGARWAGAEFLYFKLTTDALRASEKDVTEGLRSDMTRADKEEAAAMQHYDLPPDPFHDQIEGQLNVPLLAFSYLLRRFALCARFCLVCHKPVEEDFDALKPYICPSALCAHRFYHYGRGPSVENEIRTHPATVDLLLSFAYSSAYHGCLDPFPTGLGLRAYSGGQEGEYDDLIPSEKCRVVVSLLEALPSVFVMRSHLENSATAGTSSRLEDIDRSVPDDAWTVLRWCVASCRAQIDELPDAQERLIGVGSEWRQFRFTLGAPDAEHLFRNEVKAVQACNSNAMRYPSLYAFHGSPIYNWHSIIRHGLWYKTILHGRRFGDGVYFSKEGKIATTYTKPTKGFSEAQRPGRTFDVERCLTLAEIVNEPTSFVYTFDTHGKKQVKKKPSGTVKNVFVVDKTEWIVCRFLLVKGNVVDPVRNDGGGVSPSSPTTRASTVADAPASRPSYVAQDPRHPAIMYKAAIRIPDPTARISGLLRQLKESYVEEPYDAIDEHIFLEDFS